MNYKYFTAFLFFAFTFYFHDPISASSSPFIEDSKAAAELWLNVIDKGQYGISYDTASPQLKGTVSKAEWERILNATRKPLGNVVSRKVTDQKSAKDPKGLPTGNYMVILFDTSFSAKASAKELVTLFQMPDNKWQVVTYLVN